MSRFIDEYLPEKIPGYPCVSTPVWNNSISRVASGSENARQIWEHPLHNFSLPVSAREHDVVEALKDMWMVTAGTAKTFPFRDPMDFASLALTAPNQPPTVTNADQIIGVGDGSNREFQLIKRYQVGIETYDRLIYLPVVSSVVVSVDSVNNTDFTVSRPGGVITFDTAPEEGEVVKAGFLFDVEVRFADNDTFAGVMRAYSVSGYENINLVEVRHC